MLSIRFDKPYIFDKMYEIVDFSIKIDGTTLLRKGSPPLGASG